MKNKRKKVLICGATGFIGRNIVEKFSKNKLYDIHAVRFKSPKFKIKGVKWHKADLRNIDEIKKIFSGVHIIIQAAATTSGSKDITSRSYIHVTDNAVMNSYIFKIAFEKNVEHLIFFSCTVMYHSSQQALKENDFNPNKKINPNYFGVANTKLYIEKMCEFYSSISSTKYTVIRHSNIYGPFDKYDYETSHFFGATVSKIMTTKKNIVVWGKGLEKRDLLHVNDLVNFVELAIKLQIGKFKIYNCGYGKAFAISDIVKKIVKFSRKKINIIYDHTKPTINTNLFLDTTLAFNDLKWKPKILIDLGIKKTIEWWKINIDSKSLKLKK